MQDKQVGFPIISGDAERSVAKLGGKILNEVSGSFPGIIVCPVP
jgi:hypothetical protein